MNNLYCGTLLLGLLTGCAQESAPLDFGNHEFESELERLSPVLDDLRWPSGMVLTDDGLSFIERDTLTVHRLSEDTIQDSWEWAETPLQLLALNNTVWVRTESGLYTLDGTEAPIESTGITTMFAFNGEVHWVVTDDNEEGSHIHTTSGVLLSSDVPIDATVVVGDTLFVLNRASKQLLRASEEGLTEAYQFGDEPRQLTSDGNTLYATTRSARWPYGGWILKLEGAEDSWTETRLSDSPPEAEQLLIDNDFVYWSSKQSITRVSTNGGTYEMLAPQTTVGSMLIQDNSLWWTDPKGGRLFSLPL